MRRACSMMAARTFPLCILGVLLAGCSQTDPDAPPSTAAQSQPGGPAMSIQLTSTALAAGQPIPTQYTGDGRDISPPLAWSGLPDETRELALICDDPDAPRAKPWVHWVIYKLPPDLSGLPEGVPTQAVLATPVAALQGKNDWGTIGYRGPAPPRGHGVHHYHFKLYALDAPLDTPPGLSADELTAAMAGHILASGKLVATYERR